jgi:hypothetical protein
MTGPSRHDDGDEYQLMISCHLRVHPLRPLPITALSGKSTPAIFCSVTICVAA